MYAVAPKVPEVFPLPPAAAAVPRVVMKFSYIARAGVVSRSHKTG
jgi:hypothetical protein